MLELWTPKYLFWPILLIALFAFLRSILSRIQVLRMAQKDPRLDHLKERFRSLLLDGIMQWRQPRYPFSGILHLVIFWGFVVLSLRSLQLLSYGLGISILSPFETGAFWDLYGLLKDVFEILVLFTCLLSMARRLLFNPPRYKGSHEAEAYLVLGLISFLMITDILFEASYCLLAEKNELSISQAMAIPFLKFSRTSLEVIYNLSFVLHILAFLFFLNLLPLSKHFHIITALPNVFFRKLKTGSIKPVRYNVQDIEDLEYSGTKYIYDLTWKHILDIYTCTECGRCSDNCPANLVGRELSPKMLTLKLRESIYKTYPVTVQKKERPNPIIPGEVIGEGEIWSCTTCGACERECPVFIEYIDKIVDMRRYLIEQGQGPSSFNQVFINVEKTGNPFGKPPAKRADWAKEAGEIPVRILKKGDQVETLLFVDSYPSFDPKANEVTLSVVRGLHKMGEDFGILGPLERDSGHQVRRMGEEGLFELLREKNRNLLSEIRFKRIVTIDPHSFNTLKNDYGLQIPIYHYSQYLYLALENGRLKPKRVIREGTYTYHDPCYLGRHNGIYGEPRELLKGILDAPLREMSKSRDRSLCCGGADVGLWYEVREEERMASKRVKMALEIGADHIVTACPFCMIHLEDAVKTMGLEERLMVVDLMGLIDSCL